MKPQKKEAVKAVIQLCVDHHHMLSTNNWDNDVKNLPQWQALGVLKVRITERRIMELKKAEDIFINCLLTCQVENQGYPQRELMNLKIEKL